MSSKVIDDRLPVGVQVGPGAPHILHWGVDDGLDGDLHGGLQFGATPLKAMYFLISNQPQHWLTW